MYSTLIHIEWISFLALSVYFYSYNHFSWILFAILLFAPDLSIIGYVLGNKIGAIIYNMIHTYILSIAIIFLGLMMSQQTILAIGLIWTAHIGMDRTFGFGLKYPTQFKDTHFGRL